MSTRKQTDKRRELSFDGMGINGPDEYRTRIATFINPDKDGKKYGPLFAAAPELLDACKASFELLGLSPASSALKPYRHIFSKLSAAIAKAEGRQP